jgi:hypothetical protein
MKFASHRFPSFATLLASAVILLCGLNRTQAQVLYGTLTGNVTDSSGAAVPSAKVIALNEGTGINRQAVSDDHGVYVFNDLQAGSYKITVSAPSFATVNEPGVAISVNSVRRVDLQLQLAQVSQTIDVQASAVTLQTDRADVSSQIGSSQIADLPAAAQRVFQSLFKIVPGFTPPAASHSEAGNPEGALGMNVNGASYNNNNTRVDGTSDIYSWLPEIVAYIPPEEAIETVNIVTNSFDAEQGMAGGSVVNVIMKSGTNAFHGSAWEYNTVSALKARNYFYYGANNPKYILNQFGGAVGGPIIKNKLFFFGDWEDTQRRQAESALFTVPNDALKSGNFGGTNTLIYDPQTGNPDGTGRTPFANGVIPANRISSAAMKMAALLPEPNNGNYAANGPSNDYFASGSYSNKRNIFDVKMNYNPTPSTTLFTRYSYANTDLFDPQALGPAGGPAIDAGQPGNAPSLLQSAAIGATHTFTPSLLIDGNIGFLRQHLGAENVDINKNYGLDVLGIPGTNGPNLLQGGYPGFLFAAATGAGTAAANGAFTNLGNQNNSNPFLFKDNQFIGGVNMGWVKGTHSIRWGFEMIHYAINHFQPQVSYGPRGGFTFTGGLSVLNGEAAPSIYNGWADFLLGDPQQMGKDTEFLDPATVRENSFGFYIRDQWQVTRKLTVTYGTRYELYPFAHRDHFGGDLYNPANNDVYLGGISGVPFNSGLNVGHGNLAPRLGVAYRLNDKTVVRAGFGISVDPNNFRALRDAYPAIISQQFSGTNSFSAAGTLATGIPAFTAPNINQGILPLPSNVGTTTFPQNYNRGYIESYNLMVQRDLGAGFNLQTGYVGTRAIRQTAALNLNAAPAGTGKAGQPLYALYGNSSTISDDEPFNTVTYNGWQTQLTRRVATVALGAVYTFSRAIDYSDNDGASLLFPVPANWARNKALAGYDRTHNFEFYATYALPFGSGHAMASSGVLAAIAGGWQVNGILTRASGTPFTVTSSGTSLNAPGSTQTADQILPNVQILGDIGPNSSYFNPLAFAPVTGARFGTSGRDILRGPGLFNLDASVFRSFRIREKINLQFRAESFGLTNTPQFSNPGANVSSATFSGGTIKALNGYTVISSSTGERQLRFALKLIF